MTYINNKIGLKHILSWMAFFFGTITYATRIDISDAWVRSTNGVPLTEAQRNQQKYILTKAAAQMSQLGAEFRLVIHKNKVYISDANGETTGSWITSFVVGNTASEHNKKTNESLLDVEYGPTDNFGRQMLLRKMHLDSASAGTALMQKNVTFDVLSRFLEVVFKVIVFSSRE